MCGICLPNFISVIFSPLHSSWSAMIVFLCLKHTKLVAILGCLNLHLEYSSPIHLCRCVLILRAQLMWEFLESPVLYLLIQLCLSPPSIILHTTFYISIYTEQHHDQDLKLFIHLSPLEYKLFWRQRLWLSDTLLYPPIIWDSAKHWSSSGYSIKVC